MASAALAISALASIVSAAALIRPDKAAEHTVIVPAPPPTYSAAESATAKEQACTAWLSASEAMAKTGNAVANAPLGWDEPETKEAIGMEARTALVQKAYLMSQVGPATPHETREGIREFVLAHGDYEEATMRRMGSEADAAIDRMNAAVKTVNTTCGLG
ncbi:hypothetical protein [Mycolicibacterium wolinskyi]|uniref:hypothetical protein n=1 Tax=Mycolicibacterium wolinskyi TaxID=59750 RepID=UPI00082DD802|nr:hypothetical protein [Mycolicibacterium wolinskyi]